MKNLFKIVLVVIFLIGHVESKANSLFDSLNSAYLNNPKLNAERANMRASIEARREAVSEFLPSVTISGYVSEQDNTNPGDDRCAIMIRTYVHKKHNAPPYEYNPTLFKLPGWSC